ncbi:uncharacterized protein LOC123321875 [Coccinella septempunctata]|uniref:uncharacterized protein LOC123321875 n=1 Tax=Coccinella septempunctata TaxID=41139 RepID=UPI001D069E2A|nr:uncharacterized protein LOC123321875 [Coccinella septempunctata]
MERKRRRLIRYLRKLNDAMHELSDKLWDELEQEQQRALGLIIHNYVLPRLTKRHIARNLKELLDVDISDKDIVEYSRLHPSPDSPLRIILGSYEKKKFIMDNKYKLDYTGIKIEDDRTVYDQDRQSVQLSPESNSDDSEY